MPKISVVIPSYKVVHSVLEVISAIGDEVSCIYIADDCCPENSGKYVQENCTDNRVSVIFNEQNKGVGGAVIAGYKQALKDGADIIVKVDGDGQMKPELIPIFIQPIIDGIADYTKGNRFFHAKSIKEMPCKRIVGNAILSFATKISSGYWSIFDPTNGYTAISKNSLELIELDKVSQRYFFESDMLYHLGLCKSVVTDIPMEAVYPEDNVSNLSGLHNIPIFLKGNIKNTIKRIIYNYYVRDFTIASINLILSIILLTFGLVTGIDNWLESLNQDTPATAGTVMLSALPVIIGMQMLLSFINYDIVSVPKMPLCSRKNLK